MHSRARATKARRRSQPSSPRTREAQPQLKAFENSLGEDALLAERLRPSTQQALSGWTGAGNEQVYVGREAWLFYRPDVEYLFPDS